MKNHFKKNKISFIVTSAALVSAVASAAYAIWQKKHTEKKLREAKAETIWRLRGVREQHTFPHPTEKDLEKFNEKYCIGLTYQLDNDTYSDNDLGNLAREYAIFIIGKLAKTLKDGETLSEYFKRKETEG